MEPLYPVARASYVIGWGIHLTYTQDNAHQPLGGNQHGRFPKIGGYPFWGGGHTKKDYCILGSILRSPFWNPRSPKGSSTNNHILTHNLYYNYYSPNPKYLILGYMDPKPYIPLNIPYRSPLIKRDLIIGYMGT